MKKIIRIGKLTSLVQNLYQDRRSTVLVGGCFDIIHIGHIKFLQEAKKGDKTLLILLESDERVKILKGPLRPFFPQKERAEVLASLSFVDFIILLPLYKNQDYENLIALIKPAVIAFTQNDPLAVKKQEQAQKIGAKVKIVPLIKTHSSSHLAKLIGME